jgi:hypothetical protein
MDLEATVKEIKEKQDVLISALEKITDEDLYNDFRGKWGDRINEIEPFQKTLYGDDYDEGRSLYELHKQHRDSEGYNEDSVIGNYFERIKNKLESLKGQLDPGSNAASKVDEAIENIEEAEGAAKGGSTVTETVEVEAGEVLPPEQVEEIEAALKNDPNRHQYE